MKKPIINKPILNSVASAVLIAFATSNIMAQDNVDVDTKDELETNEVTTTDISTNENVIMVTASRRSQALQDVPAAITAIDPEEFTNSGLTTLGDVIEYTPGFNINRGTGQRGRGSITARGVGQQSTTAVVAIYVDDVPMTSNSGFAGGSSLFFDGLMGDVERVELIKGPQGTLFGATAIGGAIRYITKEPALEELRGGVSVNLSDTKEGDINQIVSGYLSIPIIENKLGLTLSGFNEEDGGLVDRINPVSGEIINKNADESETSGYSVDVLYQASERLDIRIKGMKQNLDFNGISAVRLSNVNKEPAYGQFIGDDQFSTQSTEQTLISGSINYDFNWATLTATTSSVEYDVGLVVDFTSTYSGLVDLIQGNPAGTTTAVPFAAPLSSEKNVSELRLTSEDNDDFEWIVGLYSADESTNQAQISIPQPSNIVFFAASFPSEYKETAVFGNFSYYITPDFDITAGIRYAKTEMDLSFVTDGPLAGGPSNTSLPKAEDNISSYLFAARYRASDDMSVYARVASGYRPASANIPVFDPFTGEQLSQSILEQDDLWSYEIGVKGTLSDKLYSYDVALWYIDWSNFQTRETFLGVSTGGNAKDGITAKGFEGAFTINPGNGFTLSSSVAYSDSTLNSDEPTINGLKGQSIPAVPKWSASTRANYDYDVSSTIDGSVSIGLRYVDGSPSAFSDDDLNNQVVNIPNDSYVLSDFNAGFYMGDITLSLYVTNLFNNEAFVGVDAGLVPGTTILNATAIPVRPRTIGMALSYNF